MFVLSPLPVVLPRPPHRAGHPPSTGSRDQR
jgi:hypothetical protein